MVFLIRWLLGLAFWCFFMHVLFKIYDGIYYVLFDSSYDLLDRGFYPLLLLIACFFNSMFHLQESDENDFSK